MRKKFMKNMNNFTSYAFLILTYSLNNLDHWFKLNRDKILYLIRQNLLLKKKLLKLHYAWRGATYL
jgi:hypothetical protein